MIAPHWLPCHQHRRAVADEATRRRVVEYRPDAERWVEGRVGGRRRRGSPAARRATARRFKGARWALLRRPEDLSDRQADTLAALRRAGGAVWRAYRLKEALRAIFDEALRYTDVGELLDRWCAWAPTLPHPRVRRARPYHPRPS